MLTHVPLPEALGLPFGFKEYYRGTSLRTAQIGRRTEGAERLVLKGWRDHWHIHENYSSGVFVPLVTPMSEPGVPSAEASEKLLVAMASVGVRRLMALGSEVSQGDEQGLADAVRAGAHGITPDIANLAPGLAPEIVAPGADLDHLQELSTAQSMRSATWRTSSHWNGT